MEAFCGKSQRVKPVDCFCRGAPSLMSDRILNVTLSEEVSTTGVTQGNLKLPRTNRMSLIGSYSLPSFSFVTLEKIVLIKKVYSKINYLKLFLKYDLLRARKSC